MKLISRSIIAIFASALLAPAALATGPEVFQAQKCTGCHSVKVAGLARGANPDEDGPDLSKVGLELDKKAIALFLLKKTEIKGEKHKKAFQGSTDDLKTVAEWLGSLK